MKMSALGSNRIQHRSEHDVKWSCGGLNSGLLACKASTLPLSYIPLLMNRGLRL